MIGSISRDTKLNTVLSSGKTLPDSDWFKYVCVCCVCVCVSDITQVSIYDINVSLHRLQVLLEEWLDKVEDTIKLVGKPTPSSIKMTDDTVRA